MTLRLLSLTKIYRKTKKITKINTPMNILRLAAEA